MKRLFLAAACAAALAGCNSTGQQTGPVLQGTALMDAQKAEGTLEHAYVAAATAYVDVDATLAPATKATAKADLQKAYAGLLVARSALAAGDANSVLADVADAQSLIAQVHSLIGR